MKKTYFLFLTLFLLSFTAVAQFPFPCPPCTPPGASGTIHFAYDNAGNQIKRSFAISKSANQIAEVAETFVEEKQEEISLLEYYPNPVENNLTITWAKSINSNVTSVFVFNMSGKLIKNFSPSQKGQELILSFHDVATGVYIINITFSNGKQDSFKILKK